jgi:hypothetical protein
MTQHSRGHKVSVVMGCAAVAAYLEGEFHKKKLMELGGLQVFQFATLQEANAFAYGVEVSSGQEDALAIDHLIY